MIQLMLLTAATILLVGLLIRFLLTLRHLPPGPWGLPVLGSLLRLSPTTPYLSLTALAARYGPVYSIQLGRVLAVVVTDPKIIREALSREELCGRADLYLTHGIMKGYGLICAEGRHWREQRSFVVSTLKSLGMVKVGPRRQRLEERIMEGVTDIVNYLKSQEGRKVNASRSMLHSVGNVVNSLVFGHQWSWEDGTWRWLQHLSEDGVKLIGVAGPLNFLPFLRVLPKYRETIHFLLDGMQKTFQVYQQLIEAHPEEKEDNFIAAFLKEQALRGDNLGSFSQPQFHHLLADLFGAGVDTTVTTLRWFIIYVAKYTEVQARIQADLDTVCAGPPSLSDLPDLPYLQAALAEAQRIRPVVPVGLPRGAVQDLWLAGYKVPKGTMVIPLQWAVHMDPAHWPEPNTFDPTRFLDEEGRFFKPVAFIPFQTGKRSCVGEEWARMILFLYASNLLYHFTVSLPESCADPLESQCGITLVPTLHHLHFRPRTHPTGSHPQR